MGSLVFDAATGRGIPVTKEFCSALSTKKENQI
jgi:hypothetical protein